MNHDPDNMELLIRYLDGELPSDEAVRLEAAIGNDPSMQATVDNIMATRHSLRTHGLQEQVKAIRSDMLAEQTATVRRLTQRRLFSRSHLSVAATILLVFGLVTFYEYSRLTAPQLYDTNFTPYRTSTSRDAGNDQLQAAWLEGHPSTVISLFAKLDHPSPIEIFLTGNAYLSLNQPNRAILLFQSLLASNRQNSTHYFQDDTEYYLAMSYLAAGQVNLAIPLFDRIHGQPSHLYHDKVGSWFLWKLHHLH